jgi:hypothetical protein
MFIVNKITRFDLGSVDEIFKKGWESQNLNSKNSLEKIQVYCRRYARWLWSMCFFVATLTVVAFICIGPMRDYPLFSVQWFILVLSTATGASFIFLISNLSLLTPVRFGLMRDFVNEYNALINLIHYEWKYGFEYPTGGPGVRPTYENVVVFVGEKLTKLASQIKTLENPDTDWGDCLGGAPDPKELRRQFARQFDILRPFGLVYPGYEPYFDTKGAYFWA